MYISNRTTFLTRTDKMFMGALVVLLTLFSLVGWHYFGESSLLFVFVGAASVGIAIQLETYRRVAAHLVHLEQSSEKRLKAQAQDYRQTESLVQVVSALKLEAPLPPMRDWAISPDFAALIIGLVREFQPAVILELGSGVSTLVSAHSLRAIGNGKVVSLDHDQRFAQMTQDNIRKHGVTNANVIYSPLRDVVVGGQTYQWYGTEELDGLEPIGILIVDGPPAYTKEKEMARYPALPLLWNRLRDDAVIIIDDAIRDGEKKTVELWLREYPELRNEVIDTEAGAVILRRTKAKARAAHA